MGDPGELFCSLCGTTFPVSGQFHGCPSCARSGIESPVEYRVRIDDELSERVRRALQASTPLGVWRYADLLPSVARRVTLGEGNTPLVRLPELGRELGLDLYVKNETCNPTWSFKDRYVSVAVSVALELGFKRILCLSAGNFGHSTAAYCANAGLECKVVCVPGASGLMRRAMQIHGASVVTLSDGIEKDELVRGLVDDDAWFPLTCLDPATASHIANPFGPAGYKTIYYEIFEQLGRVPDAVCVPVGGGDCLTGIWRAANELVKLGLSPSLPRMVGCQSSAAAPLVDAVEMGRTSIRQVPELATRALSIRHGRCSPTALEAVLRSNGTAVAVSDDEIIQAIRSVARYGLLPEAASATTVASVVKLIERDQWSFGPTVVCVMTGTAAKWSDLVAELAGVTNEEP